MTINYIEKRIFDDLVENFCESYNESMFGNLDCDDFRYEEKTEKLIEELLNVIPTKQTDGWMTWRVDNKIYAPKCEEAEILVDAFEVFVYSKVNYGRDDLYEFIWNK